MNKELHYYFSFYLYTRCRLSTDFRTQRRHANIFREERIFYGPDSSMKDLMITFGFLFRPSILIV